MKTAAVYVRQSTKNVRDDVDIASSNDRQLEDALDYAKANGLEVVQRYVEKAGTSGHYTDEGNRVEFYRMVADAKAGVFAVLISWQFERLFRNQDAAGLLAELRATGVEHHTYQDGKIVKGGYKNPDEKFTENGLPLFLAEKYRHTLRGNVISAGNHRIKHHTFITSRLYGYDNGVVRGGVFIPWPRKGKGEVTVRRINEEQAAIVRRVFTDSANGVSKYELVRRLNADGTPPPSNGDAQRASGSGGWTTSTVRTMLDNEHYKGLIINGRTHWCEPKAVKDKKRVGFKMKPRKQYVEDGGTCPAGARCPRPEVKAWVWEIYEDTTLAIVDATLWQKAQREQRHGTGIKPNTLPTGHRGKNILDEGLARCGRCGAPLTTSDWKGRLVLQCSNVKRQFREKCPGTWPAVHYDRVLGEVFWWLQSELLSPEAVRAMAEAEVAVRARRPDEREARGRQLAARDADLAKEVSGLVATIGMLAEEDRAEVIERLATVKAAQRAVKAELAALDAERADDEVPALDDMLADVNRLLIQIQTVFGAEDVLDAWAKRVAPEARPVLQPSDYAQARVLLRRLLPGGLKVTPGEGRSWKLEATGVLDQVLGGQLNAESRRRAHRGTCSTTRRGSGPCSSPASASRGRRGWRRGP